MASKKGNVIHTSKLTCEQVSRQRGGVEQVAFLTEKGDALYANGPETVGRVTFALQGDARGRFEPGDTCELTITKTGNVDDVDGDTNEA